MEKAQITRVEIVVGNSPDKESTMIMSYDKKKPVQKLYDTWAEASKQASAIAFNAGLDSVDVVFRLQSREYRFMESTPNVNKGERLSPAIVVVEHRLERLGFECQYVTGGQWVIHRPDPVGGYSRRGYFSAAQIVELGASDSDAVDEAIKAYSSNSTTNMSRYIRTVKGDTMAKAAKATKAAKAEKPAKEVVTVKVDGEEYALSPKQSEVWEQIKERSGTDEPLGSDDERLSDPDSIAAMKLATEIGCAQRAKFGNRWWYFANEKDMNARVKAYEKEAEEAAEIKTAAKKPSKVTESPKSAAATKGTAKKVKAPLKKPSEK